MAYQQAARSPPALCLAATLVSVLCFASAPAGAQAVGPGYTTPPSITYGELYRDVVQGDEGSAQVVRLGHRGTPSVTCSDEVAIPRRPAP
jgi:hypothetical protein